MSKGMETKKWTESELRHAEIFNDLSSNRKYIKGSYGGKYDQLDGKIGFITRLLSDYELHNWRMYPSKIDTGDSCIMVVFFMDRVQDKEFRCVRSDFYFESDTSHKEIEIRLWDALNDMDMLVADEYTQLHNTPWQKFSDISWESLVQEK